MFAPVARRRRCALSSGSYFGGKNKPQEEATKYLETVEAAIGYRGAPEKVLALRFSRAANLRSAV